MPAPPPSWPDLDAAAEAAGLNLRVVVARGEVEAAFTRAARNAAAPGLRTPLALRSPSAIHAGWRSALLLGSAGRPFWERCRAAPGAPPDPLDRCAEREAATLLEPLRERDPSAQSVFPFRHARQVVPFQALAAGLPWAVAGPFGVAVHPRFGPWFAWRAALLTALETPPTPAPAPAPCAACPAPCVAACPAGAVARSGFAWEACVDFRLAQAPCRETCLAREACPAGAEFRYGAEQMAYHYRASLRMIRQWRSGGEN
jgi:hypothetical protein